MFLEQRQHFFSPPQFNNSAANLLGTTQTWPIDRTFPIEEIIIQVDFTVTTALQPFPITAQTPDQYDGILTLLQRINLSTNDGKQPRSVVDCTGVGLLEYNQRKSNNLDQATMQLAAISGLVLTSTPGTYANPGTIPVGNYTATYRVPCAPTDITDPLRSRLYLPVHLYPQDPVLKLQFQSAANMYSSGVIGNINTTIILLRREPTTVSESILRKNPGTNPNGYIDWDLIETPFTIAPGIGSEQRFALPIPGQYMDFLQRQYLGGANITRNPIDGTGTGITVATGFGVEQRWRLETGLTVKREWRWKHLRTINDYSGSISPIVIVPSSGTVETNNAFIGGTALSSAASISTNFRPPSSVLIDFAGDGVTQPGITDLSSCLDCNTPANNGLKMEIIGTPANVATNASYLFVMGRRLFGDLSKWSAFS